MAVPIGGFGFIDAQANGGAIVRINTQEARAFYRDIAIRRNSPLDDVLGLYTFLRVGRRGELDISMLKGISRGLWQAYKECDWNPKGKIYFGSDKIRTCEYELNMTECFEEIDKCLKFLKRNNGTFPIVGDTPLAAEGRALWNAVLDAIFLGKGNDFADIVAYANHPNIVAANAAGYWTGNGMTTEEWGNWHEQQTDNDCDGHLTQIDNLKNAGYENLNIDLGNYNQGSKTYEDSAIALFERQLSALPTELKLARKRGAANRGLVFKVHPAIFRKYRSEIMDKYKALPDFVRFLVDGQTSLLSDSNNVLRYEGIPVICMDEWELFDETTGIQNPRSLLALTGAFLIGWGFQELPRHNGSGVVIQSSPLLRDKGRTDIFARMEVGMGLASGKWFVNASKQFVPA